MSDTQPQSDPLKPSSLPGGRSLLIAGARLTGDLHVPGTLELEGTIDGRVAADVVVIETSGAAQGEVYGRRVSIKGRFDGRLSGGDVRLLSSARVTGQISCTTLTIEAGAEVNATFTHALEVDPSLPLPSFTRKQRQEPPGNSSADDVA